MGAELFAVGDRVPALLPWPTGSLATVARIGRIFVPHLGARKITRPLGAACICGAPPCCLVGARRPALHQGANHVAFHVPAVRARLRGRTPTWLALTTTARSNMSFDT